MEKEQFEMIMQKLDVVVNEVKEVKQRVDNLEQKTEVRFKQLEEETKARLDSMEKENFRRFNELSKKIDDYYEMDNRKFSVMFDTIEHRTQDGINARNEIRLDVEALYTLAKQNQTEHIRYNRELNINTAI